MRNPVSRMRTATSAVSGAAVASVARALRVLKAFADHPGGIALTRLSAELGYGKASLSKIMSTLEREGFVRRDGAGHFHLSWRLLALAFGHAQRVGISGVCMPVLQALADETDELVQLAVIEGDHVLFVAKAEGPGQALRLLPLVGVVGGGGRAIAARSLHGGRVVGAIAVSGPSCRLPLPRLKRLAPRVQRAARELQALWPHEVTARDFGLGVRPPNGGGRPARSDA